MSEWRGLVHRACKKEGVERTLVHPCIGAQVAQPRTVPPLPSSQRFRYALHKPPWFGVFLKGLSELLGAYNHESFEAESLKGALMEELGKEPASGHGAELPKCVSRPFSRGGSCQSWERSHQKWRVPTRSPYGDKKLPGFVLIFLKWCGTDSPFVYMCFTADCHWNQYPSLTLMDLHRARRETQDSVQLAYALSSLTMRQICERMAYQPSRGQAFWSDPTQSAHFALIRYIG